MKRVFDLFFSVVGIFSLLPVFVVIFILIKRVMPGPVFFVQQRVGKCGKPFSLIKFRTMMVARNKESGSFDAGDTSRITPFGGFLRKYKLDELPQLLNVLLGDMSFVGPRPEVKQWTSVNPEKWKIVHSVKPGITDNASIEFRNEELILNQAEDPIKTYKQVILPRKLDLYIDYVHKRSFFGDIAIILKTIKAL